MKFIINGSQLKAVLKHFTKLYDKSIIAKGAKNYTCIMTVTEDSFILESSLGGVYIKYQTSDVTVGKPGSVFLDLVVLFKSRFKNSAVAFELDSDKNILRFVQGKYKGNYVPITEVDEFDYDEDAEYITLPSPEIEAALNGIAFKPEKGTPFLPVSIFSDSKQLRVVSMDNYKSAFYYKKTKGLQSSFFTIPHGIMQYIMTYLANTVETFQMSSTEADTEIFIDTSSASWNIVIPVIEIDETLLSYMKSIFNIVITARKEDFDFKFNTNITAFKEAIADVIPIGDSKDPFIRFLVKDSSLYFYVKSHQGEATMNIPVEKVVISNSTRISVYSRHLQEMLKLYPGKEMHMLYIGEDVEKASFKSNALLFGTDDTFVYMFPISTDKD